MQKLWCWRCKMEVGMLDDEEYEKPLSCMARELEQRKEHGRIVSNPFWIITFK